MIRASRLACALATAALAFTSLTPLAQAAPLTPTTSPESVGFDSARLKVLDAAMAKAVADGRVAGMTTLLARHGKIVEFNTYGKASIDANTPMTKDEIFRIYSMTKPLTGVAMMILFEQGKWRLDDPVTRYVPEFKNLRVMTGIGPDGKTMVTEEAKRPPTMREIMSHTAGFGYGLGDVHPVDKMYREKKVLAANGLKEMVDRTATIPLMFQPGTSWSYSNAVDIQGYIVEKLSGHEVRRVPRAADVFKPLKMNGHRRRRTCPAPTRRAASPPCMRATRRPARFPKKLKDLFGTGHAETTLETAERWSPAAAGWWARPWRLRAVLRR